MPKLIFIEFRTMCMPYMWLLQLMHPKNHMDKNESSKKKWIINFPYLSIKLFWGVTLSKQEIHLVHKCKSIYMWKLEPIHQLRKNINTCVCVCVCVWNKFIKFRCKYLSETNILCNITCRSTMKVREQAAGKTFSLVSEKGIDSSLVYPKCLKHRPCSLA